MPENRRRLIPVAIGTVALLALVGGAYLLLHPSLPSLPAIHTATPVASAAGQRVALTVYNQGTALVKDRRTFEFGSGSNEVSFVDVAAQIDPTSVHFTSLTDPQGTQVLEQNYVFDLVGTSALLQRYLDETIQVVTEDGTEYEGQLLSGRDDVILQTPDGQVIVVRSDRLRDFTFPELPEGLITRPTLVWLVEAARSGQQDVEVTYLTGGINWYANYTALLARDNTSLDLDGWVTLSNTSGATFEDSQLKLVAGELSRVAAGGGAMPTATPMIEMEAMAAPPVEEREFFEYHLYEVPRPVTVRDNETKQIEFVRAVDVPAERFFVYDGAFGPRGFFWPGYYGPITDPSYGVGTRAQVAVMVEFATGEENGIGADMPAGVVRVYQEDVDGAALLVGEDTIQHTPKGETVRLYVGDAFDIVGERVQTDFTLISDTSLKESYEITLRNHKDDEAIEVRIVEHLFRWSNWQIIANSTDYVKLDASTIEFRIRLEPEEEQTVSYTVRYSWP
jgi:hypothetical protein